MFAVLICLFACSMDAAYVQICANECKCMLRSHISMALLSIVTAMRMLKNCRREKLWRAFSSIYGICKMYMPHLQESQYISEMMGPQKQRWL